MTTPLTSATESRKRSDFEQMEPSDSQRARSMAQSVEFKLPKKPIEIEREPMELQCSHCRKKVTTITTKEYSR